LTSLQRISRWRFERHNYLGGWGAADAALTLSKNRFEVLQAGPDEYEPYTRLPSVPSKRNEFLESTMGLLGGGESELLSKLKGEMRTGGGIDDAWRTMQLLDKPEPPSDFRRDADYYVTAFGGSRGCVKSLLIEDIPYTVRHNLSSNPGPSYKSVGFESKRESLSTAWDTAGTIISLAEKQSVVGVAKPRYAIAGRTKKALRSAFEEKERENAQMGRSVFMADHHENLVGSVFTYPLTDWCHSNSNGLLVGFNKFSGDPAKLERNCKPFDTYVNGDISKFDVNVGRRHKRMFFDILRCLFDVSRGSETRDDNLLDWLEDEFTFVNIVLPTGKTVISARGIPSGSGLTSLAGTIINYCMWIDVLAAIGIDEYYLGTYGDDVIVAYNQARKGSGLGADVMDKHVWKRLDKAQAVFERRFGMKLCLEGKTWVGHNLFVKYVQPNVPKAILDKSRSEIRKYRALQSYKDPNFLKRENMVTELSSEPIGPAPGTTHRWSYLFRGSLKFLSHHLKQVSGVSDSSEKSIQMIRPTWEVISNLLLPEKEVSTIFDHIRRLEAALVENWGNSHVVNRIMHYYYDAWLLRKNGVHSRVALRTIKSFPRVNEERAWYRKIDEVVDLLIEDSEFCREWDSFCKGAKRLHDKIFGGGSVNWGAIRSLRAGKQLLGPSSMFFRTPGPADSFNTLESLSLRKPWGHSLWVSGRNQTLGPGSVGVSGSSSLKQRCGATQMSGVTRRL